MGVVKDIISIPFKFAEQNGRLKILICCVFGIDGCGGGGLFALQKKGTSPLNYRSNEPFSKFLRQQMAISKFRSDKFRESTRFGCGIHPLITFNLEKDTRSSDYQYNEPVPKFIRSPFSIYLIMPPGLYLQPLPWGLWGGGGGHFRQCHLQRLKIHEPSNHVGQSSYIQIFIGGLWICLGKVFGDYGVWGNGASGGLVALQSL